MEPSKITEKLTELELNSIVDEKASAAIVILVQIIEEINSENQKLKAEIQYLKKENSRLKGDSDSSNNETAAKDKPKDRSSEKERQERETPENKKQKDKKKHKVRIDRTEICRIDKAILPQDAKFKGYQEIIVQEITIKTDNVMYQKEVYYSKSENKTYIAELPSAVTGEYGPGIKSLVHVMKHVCNMSEPKVAGFLNNFGVVISQSTISRILTKGSDIEVFHQEKAAIFEAGLNSTTHHHIDATGAIVNGQNHHVQILCNPYYSAFFTCEHKDRLSIIDILLCGNARHYLFNEEAFILLDEFKISGKLKSEIREIAFDRILDEAQMQLVLDELFPDPTKRKNNCLRIMESGAISYYHNQSAIPVVQNLLSDNAPEYKRIAENQGLCWIHDGRSYKSLNPVAPSNQHELEKFLDEYWDYYQSLLDYKKAPNPEKAAELSSNFDELFSTKTDYAALNDRIEKTKAKKEGLLLVLEHPEIELHNNPAELEARALVRKRDVSLHTITEEGTRSQDTFLTIVQTAKKLGISAYDYLNDRISKKFELPSLSELIRQKTNLNNFCIDTS